MIFHQFRANQESSWTLLCTYLLERMLTLDWHTFSNKRTHVVELYSTVPGADTTVVSWWAVTTKISPPYHFSLSRNFSLNIIINCLLIKMCVWQALSNITKRFEQLLVTSTSIILEYNEGRLNRLFIFRSIVNRCNFMTHGFTPKYGESRWNRLPYPEMVNNFNLDYPSVSTIPYKRFVLFLPWLFRAGEKRL